MSNKLIICHACLSTDRTLFPIKELQDLLINVNLFDLNLSNEAGVCWECKRIFIKFSTFKKQIELAQESLHQVKQLQVLQCLSSLSCAVSTTPNFSVLHNELANADTIDNQPKEIKQETNNADDVSDHNDDEKHSLECEAETEIEIKKEVIHRPKKATHTEKQKKETHVETRKDSKRISKKVKNLSNKKKVNKLTVKKKKKMKAVDDKVDFDDIKDKFTEVEFTEEQMVKSREEKRSHPNFKKLPYNCDMCVLGFTRKENHEMHMEKRHNASIGRHICPVCQVCFASAATLIKHVRKHYHCYRCKLCSYETTELWSALSHGQVKHSGDAEGRIHCKKCSHVAKTPEELEKHMKSQHYLVCKECGEKFKGSHTLKTHKRRIHATVREHKCEACPRAFRSRGRLEAHMAAHGPAAAARVAYCAVCHIQYKNVYVYRNHLVNSKNHSEMRYHCEECGKTFASKVYYKRHYTFYHQKESNHKCELCDRLFISDFRLRHHRQTRHGAERLRNHACDQCAKKFYTATTLRAHILTHSSARTFMCAHCGDTFKQRPALYTHTRLVHQGLKKHAT
ncbi:zinc finger protein 58-like [Leguminivora glycinivorella]|uniref:zinc finger protein 58-like n=1 Tax=Leguminivora glycinivorella TaxID=1035111 RepID=UPI00200C1FDC|nr:zinc finger protein 58-like [Leguminivora glycinivorella]